MLNPHFDHDRIAWSDRYAGEYEPPEYDEQFELQWRIGLAGDNEYFANPGASTDDSYIDDRIYEWTGRHPSGTQGFHDPTMGVRVLDHPIDPSLIAGRSCVDIGCGMGRWTRTAQRLGAREVLSIDISESAIESTRRFNSNVLRTNVVELASEHPEFGGKFDFAVIWGVAHHTHNPKRTFESAAFTVKPGGALYLMVYSPEGIHNLPITSVLRQRFHRLKTVEKRLAFVDHVHQREWDTEYGLTLNIRNWLRNALDRPRWSKLSLLDMMEPFYNWVIPLTVIDGWMDANGFETVTLLNEHESPKVAYHVLGRKPDGQ